MFHAKVYYMIPSLKGIGYIFPEELEDNENDIQYDFSASAVFVIKQPNQVLGTSEEFTINNGKLEKFPDILAPFNPAPIYTIKAVDNGGSLDYSMTSVSGNLYAVKTENYGHFYFQLVPNFSQYIGEEMEECRLCLVKPLDIIRLEDVCREYRFFFVGESKPNKNK